MQKKEILITGLLTLLLFSAYTQTEDLSIVKSGGHYRQSGMNLSYTNLESLLKSYPDSESQIRKCNADYNVAFPSVLFGTIGIAVGSGIILSSAYKKSAEAGKDKEKDIYTSGIVITALSGAMASLGLTFMAAAGRHKKKAITMYNANVKDTDNNPPQVDLQLKTGGFGIRIYF
jgi:F0F1-type ATP synthase membrane subunit c/vacuolar-type H+-ATPase subunit K